MNTTKYFIDSLELNFLKVEYETFEDKSSWPFETVIDLCGAALNGTMSIKLESLPADWKQDILEQIRQKETVWEMQ